MLVAGVLFAGVADTLWFGVLAAVFLATLLVGALAELVVSVPLALVVTVPVVVVFFAVGPLTGLSLMGTFVHVVRLYSSRRLFPPLVGIHMK